MPLESLFQLVEELRQRIDAHGSALGQSEALTRSVLIDPLLREMGWDTEDPTLVMPEYKLGVGFADYALLSDGLPVMMLEAKKLDTSLYDAASQGIGYCITDGIKYFSVTNGRRWEIYETHKPVPLEQKRIVWFDLKGMSSAEVCLQALALWRNSLADKVVNVGQTPVLGLEKEQPVTPPTTIVSTPMPVVQPQNVVLDDNAGWIPLSEFDAKSGKPVELQFPDNSSVKLRTWKDMLVETARWMLNSDYLSETDCPIKVSQGSRYLIATRSVQPTGDGFRGSKQIGPLHIETGHNSGTILDYTRRLIKHLKQDANQFKVRLG